MSQREVDHAARPGRLPGGDHIVVGEVTMDDQPSPLLIADIVQVGGELGGQPPDQAAVIIVLPGGRRPGCC